MERQDLFSSEKLKSTEIKSLMQTKGEKVVNNWDTLDIACSGSYFNPQTNKRYHPPTDEEYYEWDDNEY